MTLKFFLIKPPLSNEMPIFFLIKPPLSNILFLSQNFKNALKNGSAKKKKIPLDFDLEKFGKTALLSLCLCACKMFVATSMPVLLPLFSYQ